MWHTLCSLKTKDMQQEQDFGQSTDGLPAKTSAGKPTSATSVTAI